MLRAFHRDLHGVYEDHMQGAPGRRCQEVHSMHQGQGVQGTGRPRDKGGTAKQICRHPPQ
eukprot:3473069-Pyramimonas_sp.AAC.1